MEKCGARVGGRDSGGEPEPEGGGGGKQEGFSEKRHVWISVGGLFDFMGLVCYE